MQMLYFPQLHREHTKKSKICYPKRQGTLHHVTRIHCTYTITHLGHIVKVDDQLHLLTVGNVCQLLSIGEDLAIVCISIEFSQKLLYFFCI